MRANRRGVADRGKEVVQLVHEGVLPPDDVALRPPVLPERVVGFGDEDGAESLRPRSGCRAGEVDLELVEALEIEAQRALGAVDLPGEGVLAPGREPGRLYRADRAALEGHHRLDG